MGQVLLESRSCQDGNPCIDSNNKTDTAMIMLPQPQDLPQTVLGMSCSFEIAVAVVHAEDVYSLCLQRMHKG